jgi:uridine phosphorylase
MLHAESFALARVLFSRSLSSKKKEKIMSTEKPHPPLFEREGRSLMAQISPEEIGRYVILTVRDPLGCEEDTGKHIAGYLDGSELIADTHMFITYTGTHKGVRISVCSTGSGAPETELALLEFFKFSAADTFVRVGTSGTYRKDIEVGDIVIASGAVRDEGTSGEYVKQSYPAVASFEVVLALAEAAERSGFRYHIGITRCNDSCYVGQGRPMQGYWQEEHQHIPEYWDRVGIKNFERETSVTYVMCSLMGHRAGAVNAVVNSTPKGIITPGAGMHETITTVLEGIATLAQWDKTKESLKKRYWLPCLEKT